MPLVDHLRELRNRIGLALIGIALGAVVAFFWYDNGLLEFLKRPYCELPANLRFPGDLSGNDTCQLLFFDPMGGFLLRLKVSLIAGLVLSAPWWLYQLWKFVTPGLRRNERRWAVVFVSVSTVLFLTGTAFAYIILHTGLELLLSVAGDGVTAALNASDYLGFVTMLLLVFGVSFEVPLIAVMLNLAGVLSYALLAKSRRWLIFLTFAFAAFITPTQDPVSMLAMAVPMVILFEGAIQFARINDKRRARRAAESGYEDLDDDEPSPLDDEPSPVDETSIRDS